VLGTDLDDALQTIVEEAASETGAPIALVSLVLDNIQYFRAHHGLPPDLAVVRATSRDTSFCQFVVRDDDVVEINDAAADVNVPQDLVDQYGIRAYLGVPIHLNGQPLGSLCVIDTLPRDFSPFERSQLAALAHRVDVRLNELAARKMSRPMSIVRATVAPLFAQLRNHLVPLSFAADDNRVAAVEMRAFVTAVEMGADRPFLIHNLDGTKQAVARLEENAEMVERAASGIVDSVQTLERLADDAWSTPDISDVIAHATSLSDHVVNAAGGITWTSGVNRQVALPLPIASAAVASVLGWVAARVHGKGGAPIAGTRVQQSASVSLVITSKVLDATDALAIVGLFEDSGLDGRVVSCEAVPSGVRVRLPAA